MSHTRDIIHATVHLLLSGHATVTKSHILDLLGLVRDLALCNFGLQICKAKRRINHLHFENDRLHANNIPHQIHNMLCLCLSYYDLRLYIKGICYANYSK